MGCGGSKSAAVSPDYPKKKDSIPKRTAPTSMSLEEKTALMEKFNAKLFDGTIADGTVTTADCTFNPPGAPAMPMEAFAAMTNGCKACFPDWTSKLCKVEEGPTPDTAICMTQQLMGCMKGDFPAMGPMPAVAMSEVPERCKTEELTLVVEVGLYTFKDGKVSKGEYKASGEFREDWKGNGGVEPSAFVSEHWPKGLVGFGVVFAWFEQLGKMPIPPGTIASRITIVPIKPGTKDKILAVMKETSGTIQDNPAFAGMKEVAAFFTDDDKMVGRTLFTDMDALTGSAEATKKVMGGMAEHFAGPPTVHMGTLDWHFKGPAAPVANPVSRVTIVPIKPGAQGAIMTKNMIETIEKGLDDPAMAGLIEVATIFSGDNLISRSLFTDAKSLEASVEVQGKVMGAMKEHFAGAPTRLSGEVAWVHDNVKASRVTIVPIKPGSKEALLTMAAKISKEMKTEPAFDGMLEVAAFFTDDDKMVTRSIFKDMASLKGSGEAQMRVMGGMKEHMAGKPTPLMGQIFWHLKGDAAMVDKPATRVTIVPLKPGTQAEVTKQLGEVDKIMKGRR